MISKTDATVVIGASQQRVAERYIIEILRT